MNKYTILNGAGYVLYFISLCLAARISVEAWLCTILAVLGFETYMYGKRENIRR